MKTATTNRPGTKREGSMVDQINVLQRCKEALFIIHQMLLQTGGRFSKWEHTSPFANNNKIIGAVEEAMRKSSRQEHMFLPVVGATFPSLGDVYQFNNLYSWEVGFSIRKGTNQNKAEEVPPGGEKEKNMQEFRCQRAGKPGPNVRSTTKCGCRARLRLLRNKHNEWYVKTFVANHNHALVESCGEKRHLKSH